MIATDEVEQIVELFWNSDDGANCVAGLSLDRCLMHFLNGHKVQVDWNDSNWIAFFEPNGAYQIVKAACLAAWPKGRGVKQA